MFGISNHPSKKEETLSLFTKHIEHTDTSMHRQNYTYPISSTRANDQWKREPGNTEIGLPRSVFGFWRRRQMQSINKGKFMRLL